MVLGAACAVSAGELRGQAPAASDASRGWDLALTGGFSMSGLTDPVWALEAVAGRPTRVLLRERNEESTVSVGLGMFAQVYHDRLSWIAPLSFGIGLRNDGRATFYLGPALRFGPHASLTGGVAIGPVAALPAGVLEEQPVGDPNFLRNLGSRTTRSWFAGVTYTFASLR